MAEVRGEGQEGGNQKESEGVRKAGGRGRKRKKQEVCKREGPPARQIATGWIPRAISEESSRDLLLMDGPCSCARSECEPSV